jgi:hypothetical protein
MPPLVTAGGTACTLEEKVEALRQRFYPTVEADLSDIADTSFADSSFHNPLEIQKKVDPQEIASLLRSRRLHRAPGSDSIPNEFLKAMGGPLTVAVAALAGKQVTTQSNSSMLIPSLSASQAKRLMTLLVHGGQSHY